MSDARTNNMSTRPSNGLRRQPAGRASTLPGNRPAGLFVFGAIGCLLAMSTQALSPATASPLPAPVVSPHRHLPVPWAPGRAPGYQWPGPSGSGPGSLGTATVGTTPVGDGPSELAIDPATHTVYVANGNNNNGPTAGGDTVSVIDTRHCMAWDISSCHGPWPTFTVGNLPSSIAVDQATGTVYVTNAGDNTVTVLNGATCNATDLSGCRQQATVPVGLGPLGIFADDANHTVYVANLDFGNGDTVSMINSATCQAGTLATCPTTPPSTVTVAQSPLAVTVDLPSHTVYVSSFAQATVFDANTCNATVQSGCGTVGTLPGDPFGNGPNDAEIDTANNTLYSANYDDTVSALDLADCDAANLAGCATAPVGTVSAFPVSGTPSALYLAVDVPLHTVYVTYQEDDSVAAVDTNLCNGADVTACSSLHPPLARTGAAPQGVVLDPQTQTLYVANEIDNDLSVINASSCNAAVTGGCSQDPTTVPIGWPDIFSTDALAADPAVGTVYDITGDAVAMVNTQTCNSHATAGCAAVPSQFTAGSYPSGVAVDPLTHTVYVANNGSGSTGSVSVVNADSCNATDQGGCGGLETLTVPGGNADVVAVDVVTGTLYVGTETASGPDLVSVFNASTCNAIYTAGCGQVPATIAFGSSGGAPGDSEPNLAVDQVTNTIYATDTYDFSTTWTSPGLYMINGATCDAANTGCDTAPVLMPLGLSSTTATGPGTAPWGVAVDEATDTVYVALLSNGDYAADIAVVNGASCNGYATRGCNQVATQVPVGHNAIGITLDAFTHGVYTANFQDASASVIDGAVCNGSVTSGCDQPAGKLPTDFGPASIVADPAVGSLYVAGWYDLSVLPLVP